MPVWINWLYPPKHGRAASADLADEMEHLHHPGTGPASSRLCHLNPSPNPSARLPRGHWNRVLTANLKQSNKTVNDFEIVHSLPTNSK